MGKNKGEFYFIKKYKKEMIQKIQLLRPDLSKEFLDKYLDDRILKDFKDHDCVIHNIHRDVEVNTTLFNVVDYLHNHKPIMAGNGTLYKNQHEIYNPNAEMLLDWKKNRSKLKSERKKFDPREYEFIKRDIGQDNIKRLMNSFYGVGLAKTSRFYNKYVGASITGTGQALISTAENAFEQILRNNSKFFDYDEMLLFVSRIVNEQEYPNFKLLPKSKNIREETFNWLKMSRLYANITDEMIWDIVNNLSDDDCHKVYFKNNLLAFFLEIPKVRELTHKLLNETKEFINPNEPPEEIVDDLETVWGYMEEFVAYNYTLRDRIIRDKYHERETVIAQDTDSTILTIASIVDMLIDNFIEDEVAAKDETGLMFIIINFVSYMIKKWSIIFLERYANDTNIPEDYHKYLDLKNEFYMPRFVATSKKKRYLTVTRLQEGTVIDPMKIDTHGLDFAKAETSDATKKFFEDLISEDIMTNEVIDVSLIMKKLRKFQDIIRESILHGETKYLTIKTVKQPEAYKDPLSEQGIKAVNAWNCAYDTMPIQLPDKVLIVKLLTEKLKVFEDFRDKIPSNIYEDIMKKIFESKSDKVSKAGFAVIAIPQNLNKIPQWIIDIADIDSMIHANVSKFNPILISLGTVPLKTRANTVHMTNIVDL